MFKRNVEKFIDQKSLFERCDKVLVALSGGADSVALLRVLDALGYQCECAHCNFHLRGEESNRDEAFVQQLCQKFDIPLHVTHFDTTDYAHTKRISIEMAARELRYQWFETLRQSIGASVIAVAHHRDDSVETFLLNLIRGTGINGLKGIAPKNGYVVRPLLQESRENILDYLQHLNQDYVTDSTNLQDEYMRNKIRLNLLPLMKELNPSVSESIAATTERLADAALIYNKEREMAIQRVMKGEKVISISALLDETAPSSLLFELLHPYGFNSSQIKDIYQSLFGQSGRRFHSSQWEVLRDRDSLILHSFNGEEINHVPPTLTYETIDITPDFIIPRDKHIACLDADKVTLPLTVRKWQAGDKFTPLGMKGKKNVSDYLTDRKFTLFQKGHQYVACQGDKIVWLIGERIDNAYRIDTDSKRALIVRQE
ncbi:MAG: tRNA lysidine(34) synthetase TilS [Bacteroides sp.]|nr:tRNA lysidine(34) synthetase TilS [Bacteroides sp.]